MSLRLILLLVNAITFPVVGYWWGKFSRKKGISELSAYWFMVGWYILSLIAIYSLT